MILEKRENSPSGGSILGIGGSPRKGGNTDTLLDQIMDAARSGGARTEQVRLSDLQFQPCVGCEACRRNGRCTRFSDDMTDLYPKIIEAKGLVLACPVHNYNVTAWMKAFIDRLYGLYNFNYNRPRGWSSRLAGQGRKAVIAAVCEQEDKKDMGFTLEAMRLPLEALGFEIVGELPVLRIFEAGRVAEVPEVIAEARRLGSLLAKETL